MAITQSIRALLGSLREFSPPPSTDCTVVNMYKNQDILYNLELYLDALYNIGSDTLLVGEAPGHKGCKLTGIPFTSEFIIKTCLHPFFEPIATKIKLTGASKERASTIVWNSFNHVSTKVPIFWNAFPFYCQYPNGNPNCSPTVAQIITIGLPYLEQICNIFPKLERILAVGKKAEEALKQLFPTCSKFIIKIPHPSALGKKADKFKPMILTLFG